MDRYFLKSVAHMYRWFVNKVRNSITIDFYKIKTWKITDNVTAEDFTEDWEVGLGLIVGDNITFTLQFPGFYV